MYAEALQIISEVAAGLVELCLALRDCVVVSGKIAVLEAEVRDLEEQLQGASPSEKPALTAQIRQRQTQISNLRAQAPPSAAPDQRKSPPPGQSWRCRSGAG